MTLSELVTKVRLIEYSLTSVNVPILKDGKDVNLDFRVVSEDGVVKHIEMIEK